MKKLLTNTWKFINSKIFGYILLIIAIIFILSIFNNRKKLKNELERKDHNIEVFQAEIKNEKLKNGQLQSSILAYEGHANELEQYNKELAKDLKKEKGKVVTFNNLIFKLRQDSADLMNQLDKLKAEYEKPIKVNDSTWNVDWTLPFIYDSLNYDIFSGRTQISINGGIPLAYIDKLSLNHNKTWLLERNSSMKLTWGQKYENDKLKVFARTSHPAFKAQLLEGVYVNYPIEKHWFTGFGIGPQFGVGYDFINSKTIPTIGIGIQYNIYKW